MWSRSDLDGGGGSGSEDDGAESGNESAGSRGSGSASSSGGSYSGSGSGSGSDDDTGAFDYVFPIVIEKRGEADAVTSWRRGSDVQVAWNKGDVPKEVGPAGAGGWL